MGTSQQQSPGLNPRKRNRHFDDDNDETRIANTKAYNEIYNPVSEVVALKQAAEDSRSNRLQEQVNSLFEYLAAQNHAMDALKWDHEQKLKLTEESWQAEMLSATGVNATTFAVSIHKCNGDLKAERRLMRALNRTDETRLLQVNKMRAEARQTQAHLERIFEEWGEHERGRWAQDLFAGLGLLLAPALGLWVWHVARNQRSFRAPSLPLPALQLRLPLRLPLHLLPRFLCASYLCLAAASLALGGNPFQRDGRTTESNDAGGTIGPPSWWGGVLLSGRAHLFFLLSAYALALLVDLADTSSLLGHASFLTGGGEKVHHPAYVDWGASHGGGLVSKVSKERWYRAASRAAQLTVVGLTVVGLGATPWGDPGRHSGLSAWRGAASGVFACFLFSVLALALAFAAWLESFFSSLLVQLPPPDDPESAPCLTPDPRGGSLVRTPHKEPPQSVGLSEGGSSSSPQVSSPSSQGRKPHRRIQTTPIPVSSAPSSPSSPSPRHGFPVDQAIHGSKSMRQRPIHRFQSRAVSFDTLLDEDKDADSDKNNGRYRENRATRVMGAVSGGDSYRQNFDSVTSNASSLVTDRIKELSVASDYWESANHARRSSPDPRNLDLLKAVIDQNIESMGPPPRACRTERRRVASPSSSPPRRIELGEETTDPSLQSLFLKSSAEQRSGGETFLIDEEKRKI